MHKQVVHQRLEGLRPLLGNHIEWQGRDDAKAGLALPAVVPKAAQHDQVAEIGTVTPPGTGPATGAGARIVGQGPLVSGWAGARMKSTTDPLDFGANQ